MGNSVTCFSHSTPSLLTFDTLTERTEDLSNYSLPRYGQITYSLSSLIHYGETTTHVRHFHITGKSLITSITSIIQNTTHIYHFFIPHCLKVYNFLFTYFPILPKTSSLTIDKYNISHPTGNLLKALGRKQDGNFLFTGRQFAG